MMDTDEKPGERVSDALSCSVIAFVQTLVIKNKAVLTDVKKLVNEDKKVRVRVSE